MGLLAKIYIPVRVVRYQAGTKFAGLAQGQSVKTVYGGFFVSQDLAGILYGPSKLGSHVRDTARCVQREEPASRSCRVYSLFVSSVHKVQYVVLGTAVTDLNCRH